MASLHRSTATCFALWLVARLYQLALGCGGEGTDVALYQRYAQDLRSGAAASPDFRPEYPPGALTLFVLPALVPGAASYHRAFAALMALFDLAACLLVFHRARLRPRAPPRGPLFHAMLYVVSTAALWPVLYARFDIAPAAIVLAALHCLDRHRDRASGALLGIAGAVKLWPFALVPLWTMWGARPGRRAIDLVRSISIAGLAIAAGAAIASLPVLAVLGERVVSAVRFHANRGLQIESTWATVLLILDRLGLAESKIEEAFGAIQVAGRSASLLCAASLPVTLVLVAIPMIALARTWWGAARSGRETVASDDDGRLLEHAVLAVVLGCMIAAKVLSPQFVLWVVPLLALVAVGPVGAMLAFLTAALTTEIYPYLYPALMDQASGNGRAILALAARNALLIGWYVTAVRRLAKQSTPRSRLDCGAGTLPGPILPLRARPDRWSGR